MRTTAVLLILAAAPLLAAERTVDPTFLFRSVESATVAPSDETTATCRYKPLFGKASDTPSVPLGVVRFGVLVISPAGACETVQYQDEEQLYYVLAGDGAVSYRQNLSPVRQGDFMYFAPGTDHHAVNESDDELSVVVMGFSVDPEKRYGQPVKLPIAHESEAKKQVVGNHPPTTLYQLLLGGTNSQRDLLAVAHRVTSLFIMEFAPGGTNFPHHHLRDEEIYLVLEGQGEIVAGGGTDGIEGRRPAQSGDAYYYRPNATVGFYNNDQPDAKTARILAVRSVALDLN